jgi:hypothetical protein
VGLRAGLDAMAKRKIPCPCQQSNPGHPTHTQGTILTELSWLPERNRILKSEQCLYGLFSVINFLQLKGTYFWNQSCTNVGISKCFGGVYSDSNFCTIILN